MRHMARSLGKKDSSIINKHLEIYEKRRALFAMRLEYFVILNAAYYFVFNILNIMFKLKSDYMCAKKLVLFSLFTCSL